MLVTLMSGRGAELKMALSLLLHAVMGKYQAANMTNAFCDKIVYLIILG